MTIDMNVVLAGLSVALFAGLIGFFAFLIKHQNEVEPDEKPVEGVELIRQHYGAGETIEQPTPYYVAPIPSSPDPLEIAGNLNKKIVLGAFMLFATFALVGAYLFALLVVRADASSATWADKVAEQNQLDQLVMRGRNLYANFCFDCHGKEGKGDVGVGLPLNKPDFKYDTIKADPAKLAATESLLDLTIHRGRPKPPGAISMPAWGIADGGTLNDEQIRQLMAFIEHGSDAEWADIVTVRRELGLSDVPNPPKVAVQSTDPAERGHQLTLTYCTTCHSFTPGTASTLPGAPNLGKYSIEGPFNDQQKAAKAAAPAGSDDWMIQWESHAPKIKPGIAMPNFAQADGGQLSPDNITDIVAYLKSLK
jgi:mono/diheme cytochrome c family protein